MAAEVEQRVTVAGLAGGGDADVGGLATGDGGAAGFVGFGAADHAPDLGERPAWRHAAVVTPSALGSPRVSRRVAVGPGLLEAVSVSIQSVRLALHMQ